MTVGAGLNVENTQFTPWVTLDPEGERIFKSAKVNITVENESDDPATHSYSIETRSKGSFNAGRLNNSENNTQLNITDLSEVNPK